MSDNQSQSQPQTKTALQKAVEFARDLAEGVAEGKWSTQYLVTPNRDDADWYLFPNDQADEDKLLTAKWNSDLPSHELMTTLGYITLVRRTDQGDLNYQLTEKSLALLERPAAPPSVFISYKRDQSSAFALLIEARLRLAGNPNPFVDKNLTPGDEWHGKLENTIKSCEYFISLIGAKTLDSAMVLKEIHWAETSGCKVISIWHGGASIDSTAPEVLRTHHAIQVTGESALEYETAVNQLLNALGYRTY
jgi:hypothetical protein